MAATLAAGEPAPPMEDKMKAIDWQDYEAKRALLTGKWSEPPGGAAVTAADVPHAEHAFLALARRISTWTVRLRGDALWMEHGHTRSQLEFSVARWSSSGLRPTIAVGAELGPRSERVADTAAILRFAMPLR